MDLSLSVESALVDGSDLVGMSIDCSRCFDRGVPQGIAFKLAERQGLHHRVLQPLRGMYHELRRRFDHGRGTWRRNLLPPTVSFEVVL